MKKLPYRIEKFNGIMSLEHETMKEAVKTLKFLQLKTEFYNPNKIIFIVEQSEDLFIHVIPISFNGMGKSKHQQVREQYLSYMN